MKKIFILLLSTVVTNASYAADLCFSNVEQSAVTEIKKFANIPDTESVKIVDKELVFDIGDTAIYIATTDLLAAQSTNGLTPRWVILVRKPTNEIGVLECTLVSVEMEKISESN